MGFAKNMLSALVHKRLLFIVTAIILLSSILIQPKTVHAASANAFLYPSGIGVMKIVVVILLMVPALLLTFQ
jgi:uncharacterized membrane protein YkgB